MNVRTHLEDELLNLVEKPSRYLGNEVNAVHKNLEDVEVRLALVFPDLYDLGLGNLGLHILYAVCNRLPWLWAERAYAPGIDMEALLRERNLPLFALESKDSLEMMDGIGITLQSELTYTNILNVLELSNIPLRTADRNDDHPLTFCGGPAVFNPEPLAPFMDFFVIGDGEDAVLEIAHVLRDVKGLPRAEKLAALALLEGVYVPALYPFETMPDGQILPVESAPKIRKRLTRDLDGATFPTDYIVPFTKQVHDRISLEVLRGCTQGCRFCQAGMTTRPVRERKIERITELMEKTLANTGYEEVSLVSLSTCDYSQVQKMVSEAVKKAREERVSVSLPSLRLDSFSVELADMVAETRKSGITFAPEAASPRLRSVINKFIPDDELLNMSAGAYSLGWDVIKLYFMIGLPTERDDDVEAIADLAIRTLEQGKGLNGRARINLGVSTFVPKPFTPFQWAEQLGIEETNRRQDILSEKLGRHRAIKFGRHDPEETFLEGLVSRADRRAADLLELAFRKGCRFDAWREHLNFEAWLEAIDELDYDVEGNLRQRDVNERLPWDHIDILIPKGWFQQDWARAEQLQHAQDCRHRKCHKCGVIDEERELCATMLRDHVQARALPAFERPETPQRVEPMPVQRLIFRYGRTGGARFLSHLEAMNAWLRTLRRARTPLAYSHGFHPHPKMAFSSAVPCGEETTGDYLDISLNETVDPAELLARLRGTLPDGFELLGVKEIDLRAPSLMGAAIGADYTLFFPHEEPEHIARIAAELAEAEEIMVDRRVKKRKGRRRFKTIEKVDVRPMIQHIAVRPGPVPAIDVTVRDVDGKPGKPKELVPFFTERADRVRVLKRETFFGDKLQAVQDTLQEATA